MKVVYKVPIQDRIMDAVLTADIQGKPIDYILLNSQEAVEFKAQLRLINRWTGWCCNLNSLNDGCNMYNGVRIMEEPCK
jgi:hypothetical protein